MLKPRLDQIKDRLKESVTKENLLSRRTFVKGVIGGVILAETCTSFSLPQIASDLVVSDEYDKEVLDLKDELENRYGCKIKFSADYGKTSLKKKAEILKMLKKELVKYPPEMIEMMKPTFYFKSFVKNDGYLSGYCDCNDETDRSAFIALSSYGFYAGIFHHEFAHAMDGMDTVAIFKWHKARYPNLNLDRPQNELENDSEYRKMIRKWRDILASRFNNTLNYCHHRKENNKKWAELNPEGGEAYHRIRPRWYRLDYHLMRLLGDSRPEGFVRYYGKMNEDEDQATVSELLMTHPKKAREISENDPILAKKIAKLKEYLNRWSIGRMDDGYWKDLEAGKVDEKYWETKPLKFS